LEKNKIKKKKKSKNNSVDRGGKQITKLPNINSAYLKPPDGVKSKLGYLLNFYNPIKMCGLCGHKHAPGEPHYSKRAS